MFRVKPEKRCLELNNIFYFSSSPLRISGKIYTAVCLLLHFGTSESNLIYSSILFHWVEIWQWAFFCPSCDYWKQKYTKIQSNKLKAQLGLWCSPTSKCVFLVLFLFFISHFQTKTKTKVLLLNLIDIRLIKAQSKL